MGGSTRTVEADSFGVCDECFLLLFGGVSFEFTEDCASGWSKSAAMCNGGKNRRN